MTKKPNSDLGEKAALYAKVQAALADRVFNRVAEQCSMSRETVRNIANGSASPTMGSLARLADYLGVDRNG